MTTAAFKSTARRAPPGGGAEDAGSSTRHRRSRSLSRFPPATPEPGEQRTPRGRFVNTVRGSGLPEMSLDDLADEFFRSRYEEAEAETEEERRPTARERTGRRRASDAGSGTAAGRRGRSVSRCNESRVAEKKTILENNKESKGGAEGRVRRQRSVSVAQYRYSDSENDMDFSQNTISGSKSRNLSNGNVRQPSYCRPTASSLLRKSLSQKDLLRSHVNYSSRSSSLTDDEAQDLSSTGSGTEKTIRMVYAQKMEHPTGDGEGSGLYEAMRKEVRHAVKEIRTEIEKVMVKSDPILIVDGDENQINGAEVIQAIADVRKSYTSKLEQSEKRRQDLLAELAVEEQQGHELTKIVRELLPARKETASPEKSSRSRRRSNDRNRMSKHLTEEAEKYIEDFLSNVEDNDISSFDGERSDTSSTIGGSSKCKDSMVHAMPETLGNLTNTVSLPAETDGVVLPWLQWETSNDSFPSPCKSNAEQVAILESNLCSPVQEISIACDSINHTVSSHRSRNFEASGCCSAFSRNTEGSRLGVAGSLMSCCSIGKLKITSFDMDEYKHLQQSDNLLLEIWRQRQRIESGSLLLCGRTCF